MLEDEFNSAGIGTIVDVAALLITTLAQEHLTGISADRWLPT